MKCIEMSNGACYTCRPSWTCGKHHLQLKLSTEYICSCSVLNLHPKSVWFVSIGFITMMDFSSMLTQYATKHRLKIYTSIPEMVDGEKTKKMHCNNFLNSRHNTVWCDFYSGHISCSQSAASWTSCGFVKEWLKSSLLPSGDTCYYIIQHFLQLEHEPWLHASLKWTV